MSDLMRPILNLNGSTAESLIEARVEAREACRALMRALAETAPNGRDYIGHPDALKRDTAIYAARFQALDALNNALQDEAIAIMERNHSA